MSSNKVSVVVVLVKNTFKVFVFLKKKIRASTGFVRASTGFEPVTSALPVRCSAN